SLLSPLFSCSAPAPSRIHPLSLHDALPILLLGGMMLAPAKPIAAGILIGLLTVKPHLGLLLPCCLLAGGHWRAAASATVVTLARSEEHTSELQSRENLVCRLLLEKKKYIYK